MKATLILMLGLVLLPVSGCRSSIKKHNVRSSGSSDETNGSSDQSRSVGGSGMTESSAPGLNLVWKRYRAVEGGLMQSLSLQKADVCRELGQHSCIDKIHL